MHLFRTARAVALVLVFAACSSTPREREIPADGSASAFVLNRSQSAMTVYVVTTGGRYRLGFVDPLSSGRFKIPGPMVLAGGTFQLLSIGRGAAGNYLSEQFIVQPGFIVNWRLPDNNLYVR